MLRRLSPLFLLPVLWASLARAETDTVLILHTNDVHDHGRVDYDGRGGLPLIASYVASQRAARSDALLFDAGDVGEKGDMVATLTEGATTFEAMGMLGYDAGVAGNHDTVWGVERLLANARLAGYPFLAVDLETLDGKPLFPSSLVLDADGVKVGVIGIARDTSRAIGMKSVPPEEVAARVRREADALSSEVDLLVVVAHRSSAECTVISRAAPEVDVFVSGHSHESIVKPIVVEETGALIVQAGSYARLVGRLEVVVDLETNKVVGHHGELVPMPADVVPDADLAAWWAAREAEVCPEAGEVLCTLEKRIVGSDLATLFAEAALAESGADIALEHTGQLRSGLPSGPVDGNAVHRAYVPMEGGEAVTLTAPGSRVLAWLDRGVGNASSYQYAGFEMEFDPKRAQGERVASCDLDPEKQYTVVLSRGALGSLGDVSDLTVEPCGFGMVEALIEHLPDLAAEE